MIALWASVGGSRMIIFLAGLQGVPQELYEAAEIDGAGRWQRFRHVTLPLISPTIFFNLVLGVIGALQVFTLAFVATQGGPAYATWFYVLHIYNRGFSRLRDGLRLALAWIFFVIVLAFTVPAVLAQQPLGLLRRAGRLSEPTRVAATRRASPAAATRRPAARRVGPLRLRRSLLVAIFMGPFLWTIATSLKTPTEIALFPPTLFPAQPRFAELRRRLRRDVPVRRCFAINSFGSPSWP